MNEQIRKLANIWANRRAEDSKLGITYTFTEKALEKFAELIVGECANVANQHMEHTEGTDYNVGGKIKQHFVVEL